MIWFNSKKAREHLIKNGVVISARKERKQTGITTAQYNDKGNCIQFATVMVTIVNESSCAETLTHRPVLKDYLHLSGFETVKEWEDEICIMNRGNRMPIYIKILKVEVIELLI